MSGDECGPDLGRGRSVLGQCQRPLPTDEQLCDVQGTSLPCVSSGLWALPQGVPGAPRGEKHLSKMCDLMK